MTTVTLSPLRPYARLIKMADNSVVATTSMLLAGTGRHSTMDAASSMTVVVPLSDPGDGTDSSSSFAAALLSAGGGPGNATPVPMLLSLSLDGGTTYDSHRLVQKPMRDPGTQRLTLTESGEDIWAEYGKVPAGGGRLTLAGCSLADVLGALPGQITPLSGYQGFISPTGQVVLACGLLYPVASVSQDVPGNSRPSGGWDSGALARLLFVAVLPTTGFSTPEDLAFNLPTDIDSWKDNQQHAAAVLAEKLGAIVFAGDAATLGSRGHYVADCSDHALNVAATFAGVVCDGSPTLSVMGGTYGLSNARTSGHEVARAVVLGSVGSPSGLLFTDTPSSTIIDETAEALILTDGVTIEPDLTVLHGGCSFDGGVSDAGFPAGGSISSLTQVNRSPSGTKDAWTDNLAIIGVSVQEKGGGVYLDDTLGLLRPLNNSQSIAVLDMVVDTVTTIDDETGLIDIATPSGVYHRTSDVTNTSAPWVHVGGLSARVVRLALPVNSSNVATLYAQVNDPHNRQLDGIYAYRPAIAPTGLGYNGWVRHLISTNLLEDGAGMVSTDDHSFFYIDKTDQNGVFLCDLSASPTTRKLPLPDGVVALRLDRVTGAIIDTVYITVSDGNTSPQAAYYTSYTSGAWQDPVPAYLAVGQSLQVNRFVGPLEVINGVNAVQVVACTGNGLYYSTTNTPTSEDDWSSMNAQNGLAGTAITHVSAGAPQKVLDQTVSRVYATTSTDLYASGNGGLQFDSVTRGKVDYGPAFNLWVQSATGSPPTNSIRTVGPMLHSPIGLGDSTHVQVTTYQGFATFPTGGYLERRLNARQGWEWRIWDGSCPFTALQQDTLSDIEANESQDAQTASLILLAVSKKWLYENSTPQTVLSIPSFFTQTNAALRKLQPSQLVHVTLQGTIPQRSSTGDIVATQWVNFANTPFYVLNQQDWRLPSPGNSYAETTTRVGTVFRGKPLSAQDMATAFQQQLEVLKKWGVGRRRG